MQNTPEKNWNLPQGDDPIQRDERITSEERIRIEGKRSMWKNSHKWGLILLLCLIVLLIYSTFFLKITFSGIREQISHIGKIKMPFSSEEVIDCDAQEVLVRLSNAGFVSVNFSEITDLLRSERDLEGHVASVSISGNSTFTEADYFSKHVPVTVFVHKLDKNRTVLTHSSKEFKGISLENAETYLANDGFENIMYSAFSVPSPKSNNIVKEVTIDGLSNFDQGTELLITAPVHVYYYSETSKEMYIGDDNLIALSCNASDFKSMTCDEAEGLLKRAGFTNIRQTSIPCGFLDKPGTIKSVSIDGNDSFKKSNSFHPDREIIITRFSAEAAPEPAPKENPTAKLAEAQGDYILLGIGSSEFKKLTPDQAARILAESGFSDISICGVRKGTVDALSDNGSIQSIAIGETEQFKSGAEFKKDQPVVIRFYSERNFSPTAVPAENCLKTVVMEKSSDELKKLTLDGVVHYFEALGFASIYKQSVVPGVTEPFAVNGGIKDIFIDECTKFKAGDEFWNSRRVTITYYMK